MKIVESIVAAMPCNVEFAVKRETVSWLTDVITLVDIEYDTNYTDDTFTNEVEGLQDNR